MRLICLIFACATMLAPASAMAQTVIGDAARAVNDVSGLFGGKRVSIVTGSAVYQNQIVSTGPSASASLRFLDDTSLDVSPGSSVKLDRYVYNPDGSARGAVVSMTRGLFRFTTGQSDPSAFRLQTPQAIIGIRGTVLEIEIERGLTHVTLLRGAIDVCARSNRRSCAFLTRPGSTVTVASDGVIDDSLPAISPPAVPPAGPGGWWPGLNGPGIMIGPGRWPGGQDRPRGGQGRRG